MMRKFSQITMSLAGNSTAEMKDAFEKNIHLPLSNAYQSNLATLEALPLLQEIEQEQESH